MINNKNGYHRSSQSLLIAKTHVSLAILVMLSFCSVVLAVEFVGGNPIYNGGSWCYPSNWSGGVLPASDTSTMMTVMPGATIETGCNAVCRDIHHGFSSGQTGGLTMYGGSLSITDFWVLGYLTGSTGNFTMHGGSAKCYRAYIGFVGGTGNWDQYGGTFETKQLFVGANAGAKGSVNLYGGSIIVRPVVYFEVAEAALSSGKINISGGKLILAGDYTGRIKRYIGEGKIVAYNGDPAAALRYDYNVTSRGMTTLSAVILDPLAARKPYPFNLGKLSLTQQNITWTPGNSAVRHNIYFGSSADDLEKISDGQEPNSYPVPLLGVETGNTYFWRVDEVSSTGSVYTGDVWQFKAAKYTVVDDMDSYNSSTKIMNVTWVDGKRFVGTSGSAVSIETARDYCHYLVGQSMRFDYKNDGIPYKISEAKASVFKLMGERNWSGGTAEILTLWFKGKASNAADQLYVKLSDGTNESIQIYGDFNEVDGTTGLPNVNAIKEDKWHEWNIDLSQFSGVNLESVLTMTIGVGKQPAAISGRGTIYIDDIRLYPKRCLLGGGSLIGDINGDCVVDFFDFSKFAENWSDSVQ